MKFISHMPSLGQSMVSSCSTKLGHNMRFPLVFLVVFSIGAHAITKFEQSPDGELKITTRVKRESSENRMFRVYMNQVSKKLDKVVDNYKFDIRQVMNVINRNERKVKRRISIRARVWKFYD